MTNDSKIDTFDAVGDWDDAVESDRSPARSRRRFARRLLRNRAALASLVVLLLIILVTALAPWIAPYDPTAIDTMKRLADPSWEHWLGTDALGRDTLTRLLYAGRTSLMASFFAVGIAITIGLPAGLVAGYFGGWIDWLLGRSADIAMTFPALILAVALIAVSGPGLFKAMTAIGLVYSPRLFRIVRSASLAVRAETYVEASISLGASPWRIMFSHVLPNVASPLLVQISLLLATTLLAEAALSLLGLGATPPTASWGSMMGTGFAQIYNTPRLVFWPGIAIAVTTLAFNLLGDGIRDSLGRGSHRSS